MKKFIIILFLFYSCYSKEPDLKFILPFASSKAATNSSSAVSKYKVSGTVSGLNSSLVILLNTTESLTVNNGSFTFLSELDANSNYSIQIQNQPSGRFCTITNDSGVVTTNIDSVSISCTEGNQYGSLVSGTIISPLNLNGVVTTLLTGITGLNGVTTDGTFIYMVAASPADLVYKFDPSSNINQIIAGQNGVSGGTDGVGTAATFSDPAALVYHNNSLYITELSAGRIRKMDLTNSLVTTLATGITSVYGITTDGTNLYYFTPTQLGSLTLSNNSFSFIAGNAASGYTDGSSVAVRFNNNYGVILYLNNFIYILDRINCGLRRFNIANSVTNTISGSPPPTAVCGNTDSTGTSSRINSIEGIATDGTFIYIAESGTSHLIKRYNIQTTAMSYFSGASGLSGLVDGSLTTARYNAPAQMTSNGKSLFIADYGNNALRRID